MRKLAWFTTGFAAACLLCFYCFSGQILYLVAGILFLLGIALALVPRFTIFQRIVAAILIGAAFGMLWMQFYTQWRLDPAKKLDGTTVYEWIEITDYSFETEKGIGADGYLTNNGNRYKVRLYVQNVDHLSPGDRLYGAYLVSTTDKTDISYLQSEGITFRLFGEELYELKGADGFSLINLAATIRNHIGDALEEIFLNDTFGFAKALLLGDTSNLSYKDDVAFRNSGIRHIVAVSGLHISILLSAVYALTHKRRIFTPLIGIPVLFLFAAIVGFTPSVNRACLMQGLMLLSILFNQEYDAPTSLAFAVLTILVLDPMSIASVSFQLSVGSILGIFLFQGKIHDYLSERKLFENIKGNTRRAKFSRWFIGTVSVSVSALVFTMPISAFYFQSFSLLSVLSNLLTLWVVTYIFCGIGITLLVGLFIPPLGAVLAWIVSWPMRYVTGVAWLLGKLPIGSVPADNIYMILFLVFAYVFLFVFFRSGKSKVWVLALCCTLALLVSTVASFAESRIDKFRVTVLDVGQGQCVLIQSKDVCYMVDCGGDSGTRVASAAVRSLWSNGIYRLDGIILTHFDEDHVNGVTPFLVQLGADSLYIPNSSDKEGFRTEIEENFHGTVNVVDEEITIPCGEGEITIFPADFGTSGNESGLCILFQAEECDILITGDRNKTGELRLMEQTELPDLEALIVGHHGSQSSTSLDLLRATRPDVAVISVGKENYYGHPEQETLDRLNLFGCRILRTDVDGTIIIRR